MRTAGLALFVACLFLIYQILMIQLDPREQTCVMSQHMTETTTVYNEMVCVEE